MTINISPPRTNGACGMRVSFTEFSQALNTWWIMVWAHTWWQHSPLNLRTLHGLAHCLRIFFFFLKSLFLISCCCYHHCYWPIHIHIFVSPSFPFLFLPLLFFGPHLFLCFLGLHFYSLLQVIGVSKSDSFMTFVLYICVCVCVCVCNICLAISSLLLFLVHTFSLGKRHVKVRPT